MKAHFKFACLLLLFVQAGFVFAAANTNPHEVSVRHQAGDCGSCHVESKQHLKEELLETKNHQMDREAYKADGVEMCSGCHNPNDGHKVGIKLDFEIPADLQLGVKNKMTCLTCHYTHGNMKTNRPQASVSFMDRMLDAERLQKSYLLRRNNADGELCLICHNATGGAK